MTTDEFERVVSEFYGDRVESYDHEDSVSIVAFADGIVAEIDRNDIERSAREGIFFLCDLWSGLDAAHPVSDVWTKEAIKRAREVQIGKILLEGGWGDK